VRVTVAAVGRARGGPSVELFEEYRRRCPWPIRLVEVAQRGRLAPEQAKDEETRALLKAVPHDAVVVTLDERGDNLASATFADRLAAWRDAGRREVVFLIGGPEGLGRAALERADLTLAFGAMTWPHLLVRVMLAEQLYRASTILSGHPYHRRSTAVGSVSRIPLVRQGVSGRRGER
jgi:23S rRNA (pseudouridine1915-N3)-methyltransferase